MTFVVDVNGEATMRSASNSLSFRAFTPETRSKLESDNRTSRGLCTSHSDEGV